MATNITLYQGHINEYTGSFSTSFSEDDAHFLNVRTDYIDLNNYLSVTLNLQGDGSVYPGMGTYALYDSNKNFLSIVSFWDSSTTITYTKGNGVRYIAFDIYDQSWGEISPNNVTASITYGESDSGGSGGSNTPSVTPGTFGERLTKTTIWNALGDSITEGYLLSSDSKTYHQLLKVDFSIPTVNNYGISGSTIVSGSLGSDPMVNRYANMNKNADLVTVLAGINDYLVSAPLGTSSSTATDTFYGALKVLVNGLVSTYGSSKVIFFTPLKCNCPDVWLSGGENRAGHTLDEYVNAIKTITSQAGVSLIDLNNVSTLNPNVESVNSNYYIDGLHPNERGQRLVADTLIASTPVIGGTGSTPGGGGNTNNITLYQGHINEYTGSFSTSFSEDDGHFLNVRTDYIDLNNYTSVTLTVQSNSSVYPGMGTYALYDSNKNFINIVSIWDSSTSVTYTKEANVRYIAFDIYNQSWGEISPTDITAMISYGGSSGGDSGGGDSGGGDSGGSQNNPPSIGTVSVSNTTTAGNYTLTWTASDTESSSLSFKLYVNGSTKNISPSKSGNNYTYNGSGLSSGTYGGCYITVSDGTTTVNSSTFIIKIPSDSSNTGIKALYKEAKDEFDSAYTILKETIQNIIADKKYDTTEGASLDNAFANYRAASANYSSAYTKALDSVSQDKTDVLKDEINDSMASIENRVSAAELKITNESIISTVTSSTTWNNMNNSINTIQGAVNDNQSEISNLKSRINTAELKITDDAIVSTVTSSSKWNEQSTQLYEVGTQASNAFDYADSAYNYAMENSSSIWELSERVNTAEFKITDEAIVSTVISSSSYWDTMDTKADTNKIISCINQTAENIKIQASKIQLEGTVTASNGDGDSVKIENANYSVINGSTVKAFFGFKNMGTSHDNYVIPKIAMGAYGVGSSNNVFIITPYRGTDNPQGYTYSYVDLGYSTNVTGSQGEKLWSNIKMYGDGNVRIDAVKNVEITSNYNNNVLNSGGGEHRIARFCTSGYDWLNEHIQTGGISNHSNVNGLILTDRYHQESWDGSQTTEGALCSVKVDVDGAGDKFFRPTYETGVINLGSNLSRWNTVYSVNAANVSSDRKLKENIEYLCSVPNPNARTNTEFTTIDMYNFVKDDLYISKYNFINQDEIKIGFIAQDIIDTKIGEKIVTCDRESDGTLGYDTSNYTNVLAGALKEAINKIEELSEEINKLKNEIKDLKENK